MIAAATSATGSGDWRWPRGTWLDGLRGPLQRRLLVPAVRLICRPLRVEGVEQLADLAGACLFVANHSSHLDAPAVLAALPPAVRARTVVAAAEDYFYRDRLRGLATSLLVGAFPFPRRSGRGVGLERAAELLGAGWNVLLFPEGTRSLDGRIGPFKSGAARLLLATGVPVVPIGLVGTGDVLPKRALVPRRGPVVVRFGAPSRPPSTVSPRLLTAALAWEVARLAKRVSNMETGRGGSTTSRPFGEGTMVSTSRRSASECAEIHRRLARAVQRHDREGARRIYYTQVLPNPAFDRFETERLSYRVGAIDEGDQALAARRDL